MLTIEVNKPKTTRQWLTPARRSHYPHDKPAYTSWHSNGQKYYEAHYLNDQLHRDNEKPATTKWYDNGGKYSETYYVNDQYHRENDKPARIYWHPHGQKCHEEYYLNGIRYIMMRKQKC